MSRGLRGERRVCKGIVFLSGNAWRASCNFKWDVSPSSMCTLPHAPPRPCVAHARSRYRRDGTVQNRGCGRKKTTTHDVVAVREDSAVGGAVALEVAAVAGAGPRRRALRRSRPREEEQRQEHAHYFRKVLSRARSRERHFCFLIYQRQFYSRWA